METTSEQNRACDSSKNVRFLCYEGFSIFSTDFKGNKNVILANISKSKNVIKNRRHDFLLLFNLTSWSQKQLKNFVAFWSGSSKLVIKCTKCNASLPHLIKCLNYIHKSIYSFRSLFVQRNKEKVVKAFFFKSLTLDYDRREGLLRP